VRAALNVGWGVACGCGKGLTPCRNGGLHGILGVPVHGRLEED
jgi:hypothetical protein